MAVKHIEIDEIEEAETGEILLHARQQPFDAVVVAFGRMGNGQRAVRKNVADLADAGHLHARLRDRVEQCAAGRLQRKIMPSRRAVEGAGRARKGTRNHASDGVLAL